MADPEFALRYPLFVLKTGPTQWLTCDLRTARPKAGRGMAIPVFTTEQKAAAFLRARRWEASVRVYAREPVFRRFLRSFPDPGQLICFDPEALGGGRTRVGRLYPAGEVLERFTKDPGWGWQYPVYACYCWDGYATLDARHSSADGRYQDTPVRLAVVLTDADLADREIMTYHTARGGVAVRIETAGEFARFVRRLPPHVAGVVFDPPTARGTYVRNTGVLRDDLLDTLESRI